MISHQVIVLGIVLSLLPPDVRSFSVTGPEQRVLRYTRQPTGSWQTVPPPESGERYAIEDGSLVITAPGGTLPIDLSMLFGIKPDADWSALHSITAGNTVFTIKRRNDGVDLLIDSPRERGGLQRTVFNARWEPGGR